MNFDDYVSIYKGKVKVLLVFLSCVVFMLLLCYLFVYDELVIVQVDVTDCVLVVGTTLGEVMVVSTVCCSFGTFLHVRTS